MWTTQFRNDALALLDSKYCALITALTDFRADPATFTEASYTGYSATSRPAITFGSTAATSPAGGRQRANSAEVAFPQNTGSSQDVIAYAIMTATTGGEALGFGFLDSDVPIFGTVTLASPGVVTAYAHGLSVDQRVFFQAAPGAVTPTGISENTAYYVGTAPDANTFTLSTTVSNANPVNTTGAGAGLFTPYTAVTIANLATPKLAIGTIVCQF